MSDLISRQAILKHIEKIRQGVQMMDDTRRASIIMNGMYLCEKAVRNQASAEQERKKGMWQEITEGDCSGYDPTLAGYDDPVVGYVCSCCRDGYEKEVMGDTLFNFCPNCGADMRGEQNE